jgi:hypothetical protein
MRGRVQQPKQKLGMVIVELIGVARENEAVVTVLRLRRVRGQDCRNGTQLIHREMKRLIEVTVNNWDVPIRSKDDLERLYIRRGNSMECFQNRCSGEHSDIIDGHNKGTNICAANIPDS